MFFMISGALLLNKEESIKTLYKKRVLRIVIVIVIASLIQYIYIIRNNLGSFNLITFIKTIYKKPIVTPYWYLYSYLSYLITLPFLRNMVKNMKKEHYYYLFCIYIVYRIVFPIIKQRFGISNYLTIYFMEANIFAIIFF